MTTIVSRNPAHPIREIRTPTRAGRGWARHAAQVETHWGTELVEGGGGSGPCLVDEIPCDGSTLTIETCCEPLEPPSACQDRHDEAVERAIADCAD